MIMPLVLSVWSCVFSSPVLFLPAAVSTDKVSFVMPAEKIMYSKEHRSQHIERQLIDSWPHVEDPISLLFSLTPFTGTLC